MKYILTFIITIFLALITAPVQATYPILRDAGTQTRGILPNERLDEGSVTLKGNSFNGPDQILTTQSDGYVDDSDIDPSSVTKQGNTVSISTIAQGVNVILNSSSTVWLSLDGSTPTKTGGLTLTGRLNGIIVSLSSLTVQGNSVILSTVAAGVNAIYNSTFTTKGITVDGTVSATLFSGKHSGDGSLLTGVSASVSPSTSSYIQNLRISSDPANNTNQVQIKADGINIMDHYYANISTTLDISKNGPGGLTVGAEAANEMLTVFLMSNGSTVTPVACKTYRNEPASPPAGYTRWRKVGYLLNNGSSNIEPFFQRDNRITYHAAITLFNGAPTADTGVPLDSNLYVSSDAITAYAYANVQDNQNQTKAGLAPAELTGTMTSDMTFHVLTDAVMTSIQVSAELIPVPLFESRKIKYHVTGSPTSLEVRLNGYEFGGLR